MIQRNSTVYKAIQAMPNPLEAERDYMECRILDTMFEDSYIHDSLAFSGGATLKKSYNICQRISRDLDLASTDFTDLPSDRTTKQLKKFNKLFKEYVFDEIRPKLNYAINQNKRFMISTDREWIALHNLEKNLSYPTLHLLYQSVLNNSFEHICIEITPRRYSPTAISYQAVTPYSIRTPMREIPTVTYEQTFWDKVFALHSFAVSGLPRCKFFISRHYFDVATIANRINIVETYNLFHDTVSYQTQYTNKEIAPIITASDIRLTPSVEILDVLGAEYNKFYNQFLTPPPTWTEIVKKLNEFQTRLKLESVR